MSFLCVCFALFFAVNPDIFLQTTRVHRLIADALGCIYPLSDILGRLKQSRPSRRNPKHLSALSSRLSALGSGRGRGGDAGQSCSASSMWNIVGFPLLQKKKTISATVNGEHLQNFIRAHQQQERCNSGCRGCDFSVHSYFSTRHILHPLPPAVRVTGVCWRLSKLSWGEGKVHPGQAKTYNHCSQVASRACS